MNHLRRSDCDEWYLELLSVKEDGKFVTSLLNTLLFAEYSTLLVPRDMV